MNKAYFVPITVRAVYPPGAFLPLTVSKHTQTHTHTYSIYKCEYYNYNAGPGSKSGQLQKNTVPWVKFSVSDPDSGIIYVDPDSESGCGGLKKI